MANNDGWAEQVRAAADRAGEPVWPLPLPKEYRKMIDSEIADIKNVSSGGYGGALDRGSVPAGVRRRDARGPTWTSPGRRVPAATTATSCSGGTGFGVRTLVELVESFEAPARDDGHSKGRGGASGSGRGGRARKTAAKKTAAKKTAAKKVTAKKAVARKGVRR